MITEDYCSYEVSKLLKEKGFNEKCRGGYHYEFDDNDNPIVMFEEWMTQPYNNNFVDEGFLCSAPTHQMAMAWLRKTYRIDIVIEISDPSVKDRKYYCIIWDGNNNSHIIDLFNSYEESIEAALKYCLEILI